MSHLDDRWLKNNKSAFGFYWRILYVLLLAAFVSYSFEMTVAANCNQNPLSKWAVSEVNYGSSIPFFPTTASVPWNGGNFWALAGNQLQAGNKLFTGNWPIAGNWHIAGNRLTVGNRLPTVYWLIAGNFTEQDTHLSSLHS